MNPDQMMGLLLVIGDMRAQLEMALKENQQLRVRVNHLEMQLAQTPNEDRPNSNLNQDPNLPPRET